MKIKLAIFALLFSVATNAQVLWQIPDVSFNTGDTVEARFHVHGFHGIASFSYTMRYDTGAMERIATTFTGNFPGYGIGNFSFHGNGYANLPGEIRTLFSKPTGTNIEDGLHIYTHKFVAKTDGTLSDKFWLWADHPVLRAEAYYSDPFEYTPLDVAYTSEQETTAYAEPQSGVSISVSPNPVCDTSALFIESSAEQSILINIFDAKGFAVFGEIVRHNGGNQQFEITFPTAPGTYFVRIQTQSGCEILKVLKQ